MKNFLFLLVVLSSMHARSQCVEPSFQVTAVNPVCGRGGIIAATDVQGTDVQFLLLPTSATNQTGTFTGLDAGTYTVQMKDACGTIRTRSVTLTPYAITCSLETTPLGCGWFQFNLSCSATGPGLTYGYNLNNGPTTWGNSSVITLHLTNDVVYLFVKDSCGNTATASYWFPREYGGYIKQLKERIKCNGQEIYPEYYGFNSPLVCLYKSPQKTLVECKQAPAGYSGGALTNFLNLPFGQDYYVIVSDGCYRDSAFFKDKTSAGGSELNPFAWRCTTFDMHSDGNNDSLICLYHKEDNTLVACKKGNDTAINPNTGLPWPYGGAEFYDLPYGCYYSKIYDPCADTLIRIDTCVSYPYHSGVQVLASCIVGESWIAAQYNPETPLPWTTRVYWPNDSLVGTFASSGWNWQHQYPTYPYPGTVTVTTEDGCGKRDTTYITQPVVRPTHTIEIRGGCPGVQGSSGSANIVLHGAWDAYFAAWGNNFKADISIVSQNGHSVSIPFAYREVDAEARYYFTNLETGTYVIKSVLGCYGYVVYDTVEIKPYLYPKQYIILRACNNGTFTFKDSVSGGVPAFSLEMLAPMQQGITSPFVVMADSVTKISVKATDACGNSHTQTLSISPVDCKILSVGAPFSRPVIVVDKPPVVYPNPSHGAFAVAFSKRKKSDYEIQVYSSLGIQVYDKKLTGIDQKNVAIQLPFSKGAYVIVVRDLRTGIIETFKHLVL